MKNFKDYLLHLAFLPVVGQIPPFTVYRRKREHSEDSHPDGCWGYSLPLAPDDLETRLS